MLYIIFAIVFSLLCGYIAKRKNKNRTTAYILGFLLGLLALCYYLIVPADESEDNEE